MHFVLSSSTTYSGLWTIRDGSMDYQQASGQTCWKPLCVQDPSSSPCSSGFLFAAEIINCQNGPKKNKTSKPAPSL